MNAYLVFLLMVTGLLACLRLIHCFRLRGAYKEAHKSTVRTRIVILGGGFGGLYSARQFEKTIAADPSVEVTLVSRENFALFTPMLHEVAAGDLDMSDIVCPLRKMLKRVRFLQGDVEGIDLETRQVSLACGLHRVRRVLTYDHLVIALGSESNFFNLPGVAERALTMKSLGDAFILRNHALGMLEAASATDNAAARRAMLTFVVAGGGFAGVETLGALNDFVREAISYYPALAKEEPRLVLVHPSPVILPELGEGLGRYAGNLASRKVEIRTDTRVMEFSDHGVELNNGETLAAHTLVWTAGVKPPEVLKILPVKKERGRIVVNEMLETPDFPGVWAIGDCAWILSHESGKPHPPTAQHALREAVCCAKNVLAAIQGSRKTPFRFTALGQLATIGHRTGVANILGWRVSGFLAWWLWRTIYLAKLPTFEKKLRVGLRWTLGFAFPKDLTQTVTLHGIDRVSQLLANAREHPVVPPSTASNPATMNAYAAAAALNRNSFVLSDGTLTPQAIQNPGLRVVGAASLALTGALGVLSQCAAFAADHPGSTDKLRAPKREWTASVHWENDTFGGTDRFYTDGVSVGISHTGPSWMDRFADRLPWGKGRRTVGYEVTQGMFTPDDTTRSIPDPTDRPYAGTLAFGLTLHVEKEASYHGLKFMAGGVGSWALAHETQDLVHELIGEGKSQGWDHQLENEPIFNLAYEYRHKFYLTGDREGWSAQAFPLTGGWLGNMLVQGQAGGLLRFGYNVPISAFRLRSPIFSGARNSRGRRNTRSSARSVSATSSDPKHT